MGNFNFTDEKEPEKIGDILRLWFSRKKICHESASEKISNVWQTLDANVVAHTKVESFEKQLLRVAVDSPGLCFELSSFQKQKILRLLRQQLPNIYIDDIHFKIGEIHK